MPPTTLNSEEPLSACVSVNRGNNRFPTSWGVERTS